MNGYNNRTGAQMTKEDKKNDIIFGIRKYMKVGMYSQVYLLEKELKTEYGMTSQEIEDAIYA